MKAGVTQVRDATGAGGGIAEAGGGTAEYGTDETGSWLDGTAGATPGIELEPLLLR
jgi:hypothetical protein